MPKTMKTDFNLTGVGGWLWLVLFGLAVGIIHGLADAAAPGSIPVRLYGAILASASLTVLVLIQRRNANAPLAAKIFFGALGLLAICELAIIELALPDKAGALQALSSSLSSALWFEYFCRSRRVQLTFSPQGPGGESGLQAEESKRSQAQPWPR